MSSFETGGSSGLPNPEEVARRVASVTRDAGVSPDIALNADTKQDVYFGLADDRTASTAVVNLSRFSSRTIVRNGQEVPEWSGGRYAHIGYYDPAQQKW